jgi:HlyD family secretion protein
VKRWSWIVLGAVVLAAAGGVWWKSRAKRETPRYRTAAVELGALRSVVSATGTIRPVVQVQVGSQVSGTVSKLYADYNSRVTEGQLLCQLEPSSFRARAAQAEAAVARADAALKEARRQLRRSRELVKENYVSQADVEAAEVEVETREADLKQAQAQLQSAAVDLSNTTIRAPIDGVVIARTIDVGQTVAASLQAPQLFLIANDLSQMQVETRIDEADIGRIRPGLPVTFTVDAYPDLEFKGQVTQVRLEPIVEQGVVTYTTVIRTQNKDLRLRPGMTANVSVLVALKDDVMKVPSAALRFHPPAEGAGKRGGAAGSSTAMRTGGAGAATRQGDASAATRESGPDSLSRRAESGDGAGRRPRGEHAGAWSGRAQATGTEEAIAAEAPQLKPGAVYVLRDGKPERVPVMTGLGDGASFEIESDGLKPGDAVIVGLEVAAAQNRNLQPPPGMGGPTFRGPGGGGHSGRGR